MESEEERMVEEKKKKSTIKTIVNKNLSASMLKSGCAKAHHNSNVTKSTMILLASGTTDLV